MTARARGIADEPGPSIRQKSLNVGNRGTGRGGLKRMLRDNMWVVLEDGWTIGIPLTWLSRLFHASKEQRENFKLGRCGIHWEAVDEDISVEGLLMGAGDQTRGGPRGKSAAIE